MQFNCFENVPLPREVSTTTEEEKTISLTAIILLSAGGTILLLIVTVILYCRTKTRDIWDPQSEYSSEYSESIADINYSTVHHMEAGNDTLGRGVLAAESSDEYEDVKDDDDLEYIDPFIC